MSTTEILAAVVFAVVLAAGLAALLYFRVRRTGRLKGKFGGSEYERALQEGGTRRQGEAALDQRTARMESFHVRPLALADRTRFEGSWRMVLSRFVDGPAGAVAQADQLLCDVLSVRGYPVGDFEQRAADISVDHSSVVANYRTAHAIALRQAKGESNTEELRQAMIHYRSLFEELVEEKNAA